MKTIMVLLTFLVFEVCLAQEFQAPERLPVGNFVGKYLQGNTVNFYVSIKGYRADGTASFLTSLSEREPYNEVDGSVLEAAQKAIASRLNRFSQWEDSEEYIRFSSGISFYTGKLGDRDSMKLFHVVHPFTLIGGLPPVEAYSVDLSPVGHVAVRVPGIDRAELRFSDGSEVFSGSDGRWEDDSLAVSSDYLGGYIAIPLYVLDNKGTLTLFGQDGTSVSYDLATGYPVVPKMSISTVMTTNNVDRTVSKSAVDPSMMIKITVENTGGKSFNLESTTDFKTWQVLGTFSSLLEPTESFIDSLEGPQKFYRVVIQK